MPLLLQKNQHHAGRTEYGTEKYCTGRGRRSGGFMATLEEEDVENIADQLTMDKTMAFILDSVVWDD